MKIILQEISIGICFRSRQTLPRAALPVVFCFGTPGFGFAERQEAHGQLRKYRFKSKSQHLNLEPNKCQVLSNWGRYWTVVLSKKRWGENDPLISRQLLSCIQCYQNYIMPNLQLYLSENTVHVWSVWGVPAYTTSTAFCCLLGYWESLHKSGGIDTLLQAINSSGNHFCLESSEGFTELTSSIYQNSSPVTRLLCTDITQIFPACNIHTQQQGPWQEKEYLEYCILQRKQKGERAARRVLGEGWWKNWEQIRSNEYN